MLQLFLLVQLDIDVAVEDVPADVVVLTHNDKRNMTHMDQCESSVRMFEMMPASESSEKPIIIS